MKSLRQPYLSFIIQFFGCCCSSVRSAVFLFLSHLSHIKLWNACGLPHFLDPFRTQFVLFFSGWKTEHSNVSSNVSTVIKIVRHFSHTQNKACTESTHSRYEYVCVLKFNVWKRSETNVYMFFYALAKRKPKWAPNINIFLRFNFRFFPPVIHWLSFEIAPSVSTNLHFTSHFILMLVSSRFSSHTHVHFLSSADTERTKKKWYKRARQQRQESNRTATRKKKYIEYLYVCIYLSFVVIERFFDNMIYSVQHATNTYKHTFTCSYFVIPFFCRIGLFSHSLLGLPVWFFVLPCSSFCFFSDSCLV